MLATSLSVTSLNCLGNKFEDDDLTALLTAVKDSSVRTLCGLTEGQTSADFSKQNLGPIDCKMMAAEFEFSGFIAALNEVANLPHPAGPMPMSVAMKVVIWLTLKESQRALQPVWFLSTSCSPWSEYPG